MSSQIEESLSVRRVSELISAKVETITVDFKETINLRDRMDICKLAKHALAMWNTEGGHLIFGVRDKDKVLVGLDEAAAAQVADTNRLLNLIREYVGEDLDLASTCHEFPTDSGTIRVGVVYIPRGSRSIFAKKDARCPDPNDPKKQTCVFREGDFLIRQASESRKCTAVEKIRKAPGKAVVQMAREKDAEKMGATGPSPATIPSNPYSMATAASTAMFKGRDREIRRLMANMSNGTHTAIFGLQRIGKTSLVRESLRRSCERGTNLALAEIDLMKIGGERVKYLDFLRAVTDKIAEAASSSRNSDDLELLAIQGPDRLQRGRVTQLLDAYARRIETILRRSPKRIVLFLDEFSELCKCIERNFDRTHSGSRQSDVHPNDMLVDVTMMLWLSSLLKNDAISERMTVVIAIRPFVAEFDRIHELQILKLLDPIHLFHLEPEPARQLVSEPLQGCVDVDRAAIALLLNETSGHPYLIHSIMHALVDDALERNPHKIREKHVRSLMNQMISEGAMYAGQFDLLDTDYSIEVVRDKKSERIGRGILAYIAKWGSQTPCGWVKEDVILEGLQRWNLEPPLIADYLRNFVDAKILEEEEGQVGIELQYRFAVPLLRKRYVQQNLLQRYFRDAWPT